MVDMRRGRSSAACKIKDREVYPDMTVFFPLPRMSNNRHNARRAETRTRSPSPSVSSGVDLEDLLSMLQISQLADRRFRVTLEVDRSSTPRIFSAANGRFTSSGSSSSSSTSERRVTRPVREYGVPLDGGRLPSGARSFIVRARSHPGQYLHASQVQTRWVWIASSRNQLNIVQDTWMDRGDLGDGPEHAESSPQSTLRRHSWPCPWHIRHVVSSVRRRRFLFSIFIRSLPKARSCPLRRRGWQA